MEINAKVPFALPPADFNARANFSSAKPSENAHGRNNLLSFLAPLIRE